MNGLCECGCGTRVRWTNSRFLRGHNLNASRPAEERFWRFVRVTDGCWEWEGGLSTRGYGRLTVGGRKVLAHRFSYELHRGPIPRGLFVCHHCDNPRCVNPGHLFPGTVTDNSRDMVGKGRQARAEGADNPNAKLSAAEVREGIRLREAGVPRREVAGRFGISERMVSWITTGRSWKCLFTPAST
jgi:hypothetical protein